MKLNFFFCRDSIRAICSKYSQVYYANCVHMFDSIWWLINGHARMIWEREENDRPTGDSVMRYTRLDFLFLFYSGRCKTKCEEIQMNDAIIYKGPLLTVMQQWVMPTVRDVNLYINRVHCFGVECQRQNCNFLYFRRNGRSRMMRWRPMATFSVAATSTMSDTFHGKFWFW